MLNRITTRFLPFTPNVIARWSSFSRRTSTAGILRGFNPGIAHFRHRIPRRLTQTRFRLGAGLVPRDGGPARIRFISIAMSARTFFRSPLAATRRAGAARDGVVPEISKASPVETQIHP